MLYSRPTEIIITSVTLQQLFYKSATFHTHDMLVTLLYLPCGSQTKLNWIIAPSSAHIPNNIAMWNALLPRHCSRNCNIDCYHDKSEWQLNWDQQLCTLIWSSRMRSWEVPLSAPSSGLASVTGAYSSLIGLCGCQSRLTLHRMILLGGTVGLTGPPEATWQSVLNPNHNNTSARMY